MTMRLEKHFYTQVERALGGIDLPIALYNAQGSQVYPYRLRNLHEDLSHVKWEDDFAQAGNLTYMRLPSIKGMVVSLPSYVPNATEILQMSGVILTALARTIDRDMDRDEVLRRVVLDGLSGTELETLAIEHGLEMERDRCAVLFQTEGDADEVTATLREVFGSTPMGDLVVQVGRNSTALLRSMENTHYEELTELVLAIMGTVSEETGTQIYAGVGEARSSLGQMGASLQEARRALDIGRMYRTGERIYCYRSLLIERLIYEIPADLARRYYDALFNKRNARTFNEEMLGTIDKFFECHLNVSEAARQLYIHRNTLVYRLDKVQRATGLDLRTFDDAITFKLMRMLGSKNDRQKPL